MTWILIVAVGWMGLAAVVGLVLGRVIRNRDRQVPKPGEDPLLPLPTQQSQPQQAQPSQSGPHQSGPQQPGPQQPGPRQPQPQPGQPEAGPERRPTSRGH
ncbi:MAG TPA: hypothetical protein VGE11_25645 [Pseudonocardia sp.]